MDACQTPRAPIRAPDYSELGIKIVHAFAAHALHDGVLGQTDEGISAITAQFVYLVFNAVAAILLTGSARIIHWNRAILPHTVVTGILGDFLVLLGLFIAIWARLTLGGNWSSRVTLKEGHELVERGPYRVVRHPIYSGLQLMILGTAVLAGQVGGFIALVICFCGLWLKLRQEEALLTKHLPGYSEYTRRTKALVPFVL